MKQTKLSGKIKLSEIAVLNILHTALYGNINNKLEKCVDWSEIDDIARKHVVLPLLLQGAVASPHSWNPPDDVKKAWKGYVIRSILHNEASMHAQAEVISILEASNIHCAVLKGSSIAVRYPRPEMRMLGDIDLLVREEQREDALAVLTNNGYHRHEMDHAFHISLIKGGTYLELHYAVTQFPDTPVGHLIQKRLLTAIDRITTANIDQYTFPVLSEVDQAIALLLHMERHMVNIGIGLRQLCDWCMFIDTVSNETLYKHILPAIEECRLMQFAKMLTRVCERYLGLSGEKHKWCLSIDGAIADELLIDILASGNIKCGEEEHTTSSRIVMGEKDYRKKPLYVLVLRSLTSSAKQQYEICNKLPIIIPVFWLYIPIRYFIRALKGDRPKQSIIKIAKHTVRRKKLFQCLELFKK